MADESATGYSVVEREVLVPSSIYSLDAIKKAAYRFVDRAAPAFAVRGDSIACTFSFPRPVSQVSADALVRDFQTELLDQDLRERVANETAAMRNAILALAFSAAKRPESE